MILDFVNETKLTSTISNLDENEIANLMRTNISGTKWEHIENVNRALTPSDPSLEFIAEFETHTLADIRKELESGLPVSVWIETNPSSHPYLHSVVITGMDNRKKEISYNDPTDGKEIIISQSTFLTMWESFEARMVKTIIGRINRETLEKYMPQETNNE